MRNVLLRCVSICFVICIQVCDLTGYSFSDGKTVCDDGENPISGKCHTRCTDDFPLVMISDDNRSVNVTSNYTCVSECPDLLLQFQRKCVSECPGNMFIVNNTCVQQCPETHIYQPVFELGKIVKRCIPLHSNFTFSCETKCSKNEINIDYCLTMNKLSESKSDCKTFCQSEKAVCPDLCRMSITKLANKTNENSFSFPLNQSEFFFRLPALNWDTNETSPGVEKECYWPCPGDTYDIMTILACTQNDVLDYINCDKLRYQNKCVDRCPLFTYSELNAYEDCKSSVPFFVLSILCYIISGILIFILLTVFYIDCICITKKNRSVEENRENEGDFIDQENLIT